MGRVKLQKQNRRKKIIKVIGIVLIVLALLAVAACVAYNLILDHYVSMIRITTDDSVVYATTELTDDLITDDTTDNTYSELSPDEVSDVHDDMGKTEDLLRIGDTDDVMNVLLIGEDARKPGEYCRSDSMILLSVNTKTKKIVACSVLRDIYVTIPGRQPNRLNAAYAYGGSKLLKQTLAENFNIQVENHMTVDFFSFVEVVDIMGGVDITMTQNEVNFMNGALHEINKLLGRPVTTDQLPEVAGTYHLNGAQALSFARNRRNGNGDFSRTRRQRDVLYALAQKAKTLSLSELDRLFNAILPKITTNMSKSTLKSLIANLPSYLSYKIEMTSIPQEGTYRHVTISKRAVMLIDFKKNNQYHYDLIYQ